MQKRLLRYFSTALALLLLAGGVLSLTSCGQVWSWLWSRDHETPVDSADLIMGGSPTDEDWIFEGAVSFTGEAHSGTDIYYVGDRESPNRTRVIVIDPGHQLKGSSAKEPNGPGSTEMKDEVSQGSTGVSTGQLEYELNLAVALLLRNELIRRGYSVVMIRETNNVSISNMERAEIANKYSAAAYIRIHANGDLDPTMHGALTICQSASNPYPDCARHYARSRMLSEMVLDAFCEQTEIHRRKVYEMDNMTGTNWSRVPTTILEMGYLSNVADDELMETDYFHQEAAIGIANGLDAYFKAVDGMAPDIEEPDSKPAEKDPAEKATETPTEMTTESATEEATMPPDLSESITQAPADDSAADSDGAAEDEAEDSQETDEAKAEDNQETDKAEAAPDQGQ